MSRQDGGNPPDAEILKRARSCELTAEHIRQLARSLSEMSSLRELIPICVSCKRILDETGQWRLMEIGSRQRPPAMFSRCLCPKCYEREMQELLSL